MSLSRRPSADGPTPGSSADDVPDDSDGLLVMGVQHAASAAVVGTGPFDVVDGAVHESVPEGPEGTARFTP